MGNFHFFGRGKILGTELHKVGQKVKKTAQSGPFIFRVIMTELPVTVLPTTLGSGDLLAGLSALGLLTCGDEVIPNAIWSLPCD